MLTPQEWLNEIDNAKEYRKIYGREDAWDNLEKMYLNDPNSATGVGSNIIFSMGDSLISGLTVPDPEFVVSPEHPDGVDRAPIVESLDNWLLRKAHVKRHVEDSLWYNYLFSRAILKIGYDSEWGWNPDYDIGQAPHLRGMSLTQFDKKGKRIEYNDITPGLPWVRAVDPHDIVVPWGTRRLEEAPWVAHRIVRLNKDLKKDSKYKNTSRLEPQVSMEDYLETYRKSYNVKNTKRAANSAQYDANKKPQFNVLWEIRDRKSGKVLVIAEDYDKFLRNDLDAIQAVIGCPYVSASFINHPRHFWTSPLAYYLGQIQSEVYDISLQTAKQRRLNVLRFLMNEDAMTDEEAAKLLSGDVGAVAKVQGNQDLRNAFMPMPNVSNLDLNMQEDRVKGQARDTIGYSRNQLGEFDVHSRRTARETVAVAQGSGRRESRKADDVLYLYTEVIKKMSHLVFNFWTMPKYIMVGKDFRPITGDELKGEYLFETSLTTKRRVSSAQRKVEAMSLMARFAGMPGVNMNELYQYMIDAANDPAFEKLFDINMNQGSNQMQNIQGTV